jgi:hypothetical protein
VHSLSSAITFCLHVNTQKDTFFLPLLASHVPFAFIIFWFSAKAVRLHYNLYIPFVFSVVRTVARLSIPRIR